ncbi:alpha/beta fold hydrolase [Azohydromonas caseinilytica]|uniref:Alpha/beta hydrolase n=1 Tax=Azohydromonas caseinilytica TaxID=2728836 RepID=A0A848FGX7_9BURK|nr:alpha/beta fold hydrolase [Azohydromonas caseinilytica]NML18594.1 alpha/beta hydrolase [Azohydromonas caseinilytica]
MHKVWAANAAAGLNGSFFKGMDAMRLAAGAGLDRLGLGPQPSPSRVLHEAPGLRLRRYDSGGGPVLLIVPAPIKAHWIWDLAPDCSVVRAALAQGCQVYLVEWHAAPADWGLDEHVAAVARASERVREATGHRPHLMGHSLGGTLSALCAARYPQAAASLVLVEAPLCFGESTGALASVVHALPPGFAQRYAHVPGSLVSLGASLASPDEFITESRLDAVAAALHGPQAWRRHLLAMRWTLQELPLPGKLVAQVSDALYREDRFMRGTLELEGRRVTPGEVNVPITAIVDERSRVVPARSLAGFVQATASERTLLQHYRGDVGVSLQHLGALIGESAHRRIWPRVFDWLRELEPPRADAEQASAPDLAPPAGGASPRARTRYR